MTPKTKVAADLIDEFHLYTSPSRLDFKMRWLTHGLEIRGKHVLEIGCGKGAFGLWFMLNGAASLTALEPSGAGLGENPIPVVNSVMERLGFTEQVSVLPLRLQDFDAGDREYDIVFCHNAVNHLDEPACIELDISPGARATYHALLGRCLELTRPGGTFVVADVARANFWPDRLGLKGPAGPVEWEKHQEPSTWCEVLEESGFNVVYSGWTPAYPLRLLGPVARCRILAYLTTSHFTIHAVRPKAQKVG